MPVNVNFVVDVWTCAKARRTHISDKLPALDVLPSANDNLRGVTVARHDTVAVINVNHVTITARIPTRVIDNTVSRRDNRSAHIVSNIHAGMKICAAPTQAIRRSYNARSRPD